VKDRSQEPHAHAIHGALPIDIVPSPEHQSTAIISAVFQHQAINNVTCHESNTNVFPHSAFAGSPARAQRLV
jgi:hypothetical protein